MIEFDSKKINETIGETSDKLDDDQVSNRAGNVGKAGNVGRASNVVKINKFLTLATKMHLKQIVTPTSSYKYAYVLLDTDNAASELSTVSTFGWNLTNFVTLQQGTVSVIGKVRDIVGLRLYPVTATLITPLPAPGKIWINNVANLNYNFTILIKEFQAQSYAAHTGVKFHFNLFPYIMNYSYTFDNQPYTPANPYIEYVTSGKGNGWFWFKTPITLANTLTIQMSDPFNPVTIATNTRMLIPLQLIYKDSNDN